MSPDLLVHKMAACLASKACCKQGGLRALCPNATLHGAHSKDWILKVEYLLAEGTLADGILQCMSEAATSAPFCIWPFSAATCWATADPEHQ